MPGPATMSTNPHAAGALPAITPARVDVERSGQARNNARLRAFLDERGFKLIPSSSKGNNCSIYSLVQQIRPGLSGPRLDDEVATIRALYDNTSHNAREIDRGRMLYFDAGSNGAAPRLLDIINRRYGCNVEVGLVMAGTDTHPLTHCGRVRAAASDAAVTHRIVICDLLGHYEAIGMK
ncbi:hypothetical protein HR51_32525 [Burkholderia cepacia]|nr:hypothetical protein HR51_32525 [Burkholderia cepacia]